MKEFKLEPDTVEPVRAFSVSESLEKVPKRTVRTFAGLNEDQVLALRSKARKMKNKVVIFKPKGDASPERWAGRVRTAKLIGRHPGTGIPDLEVTILGRTGSELTLSLVENYIRVVESFKEAEQFVCYTK